MNLNPVSHVSTEENDETSKDQSKEEVNSVHFKTMIHSEDNMTKESFSDITVTVVKKMVTKPDSSENEVEISKHDQNKLSSGSYQPDIVSTSPDVVFDEFREYESTTTISDNLVSTEKTVSTDSTQSTTYTSKLVIRENVLVLFERKDSQNDNDESSPPARDSIQTTESQIVTEITIPHGFDFNLTEFAKNVKTLDELFSEQILLVSKRFGLDVLEIKYEIVEDTKRICISVFYSNSSMQAPFHILADKLRSAVRVIVLENTDTRNLFSTDSVDGITVTTRLVETVKGGSSDTLKKEISTHVKRIKSAENKDTSNGHVPIKMTTEVTTDKQLLDKQLLTKLDNSETIVDDDLLTESASENESMSMPESDTKFEVQAVPVASSTPEPETSHEMILESESETVTEILSKTVPEPETPEKIAETFADPVSATISQTEQETEPETIPDTETVPTTLLETVDVSAREPNLGPSGNVTEVDSESEIVAECSELSESFVLLAETVAVNSFKSEETECTDTKHPCDDGSNITIINDIDDDVIIASKVENVDKAPVKDVSITTSQELVISKSVVSNEEESFINVERPSHLIGWIKNYPMNKELPVDPPMVTPPSSRPDSPIAILEPQNIVQNAATESESEFESESNYEIVAVYKKVTTEEINSGMSSYSTIIAMPASYDLSSVELNPSQLSNIIQPVLIEISLSFRFDIIEVKYKTEGSKFLIVIKFTSSSMNTDFTQLSQALAVNIKSAVVLNMDLVDVFSSLIVDEIAVTHYSNVERNIAMRIFYLQQL